jgi:NADPH-dependent 2,4-dienoyl-CoA reductase/sulfur reductase-like enzyme
VETAAGERLGCDLLAVAIGVRPRTGLAGSAELDVGRGIRTSRRMITSDPDVFAAGDAAEVTGADGGAGELDTLWSSALAQGRIAGTNMTGATEEYRRSAPLNVTCLAGVVTTIIGAVGGGEDPDLLTLTRGQSERWRTPAGSWTAAAGHGADRIRLVIDDTSVVGAVVMGDQTHSEAISDLVRQRTDISTLRGALANDPENAIPTLLAMGHAHLRAPDPVNGGPR